MEKMINSSDLSRETHGEDQYSLSNWGRNKKHLGAVKGKNEFQKRNKLKTLLKHMYFQEKTHELWGFSFGVKI